MIAPGGSPGAAVAAACFLLLAALAPPRAGAAQGPQQAMPEGFPPELRISEFQASNRATLEDEDGDSSDWIELHNRGVSPVDLGGWALTDDPQQPRRWLFPAGVVLPPGGFLLVFASGKDRAVPGAELHTSFRLDADGEYLALVEPGGAIHHEYAPAYPAQYEDVSYGLAFPLATAGQPTFFPEPTPGAANGPGGPLVTEVLHAPLQPGVADTVLVRATVLDDLGPAGFVELVYRVMYGNEIRLPMYDDGTNGDLLAGDNIWTGTIPAGAAAPGELLRWRVEATDSTGRWSRFPYFSNPLEMPEYLGTVVADPGLQSALPIYQWFVEDPAQADTVIGTRCSLWYDGELYDNVHVRARGSAALLYPKKFYKFDFLPGRHFRFDPALDRVDEVNLNSTWIDKAYVRQVLAWETYRDAGAEHSISFPVRLEQNGAFFSVAIFVEQPDEDYLRRQGLDPDGALYKMFNPCTSAFAGVEKKTRLWEDNSDLQAFIGGILQADPDRQYYLFDNLDIPAVVNYLAATSLMHDNDHLEKNYYLYRDSDGDGEWRMLPWDKDLTFGRNYTLQGGLFDDTIWADDDPYSHPLFGDSDHRKVDNVWNRLIDAVFQTPETREMYLRRLRTLMDELLQEPGTPAGQLRYEQRVEELRLAMDPDVALDQARWGLPSWGTLQLDFHGGLKQLVQEYLAVRRVHLFLTHSDLESGIIPARQADFVSVGFGQIEAAPASGDPAEAYVELRNPNPVAVDLSGWTLTGGIGFTFPPGSVLTAGGRLYLSPDPPAFRARATPPTGGMKLLVLGPWQGDLLPGEDLVLLDAAGNLVNLTGGPVLAVHHLQAGARATVLVAGTTPGASQLVAGSSTGPGPTPSPFGDLALSPPILPLGQADADLVGVAVLYLDVPPPAAGHTIWLQALDTATGTLTPGIAVQVP